MNIFQPLLIALRSLKANKMRSFLTMLGVIIGIASVITLVAIMDGFSNMLLESFESMGTNKISVIITDTSGQKLNVEQLDNLYEQNKDTISSYTISMSMPDSQVKVNANDFNPSVTGVSEMYCDVNGATVSCGNFLSYYDIKDGVNSCVLGSYAAKSMFGKTDVIGERIKIMGYSFKICGVLSPMATDEEASADDVILIPYTTMQKITHTSSINSISFSTKSADDNNKVKFLISNLLFSIYKNDNSYSVISMNELQGTMDSLLDSLSAILVGVAAISLLVGGVGIMNIMLVSVTERIKEIGIRKSVGATSKDILSQFIVEAVTTSVLGGMVGIIFGIFLAWIATMILSFKLIISFKAVLIAVVVSSAIGVLFGYLPAKKAASMPPIEALRHE